MGTWLTFSTCFVLSLSLSVDCKHMRDLSPLNKLPKVDVYAKGLKDRIPPISNADTKVRPIIYMHGIFGKADEKNFACQYIPSVSWLRLFLFAPKFYLIIPPFLCISYLCSVLKHLGMP